MIDGPERTKEILKCFFGSILHHGSGQGNKHFWIPSLPAEIHWRFWRWRTINWLYAPFLVTLCCTGLNFSLPNRRASLSGQKRGEMAQVQLLKTLPCWNWSVRVQSRWQTRCQQMCERGKSLMFSLFLLWLNEFHRVARSSIYPYLCSTFAIPGGARDGRALSSGFRPRIVALRITDEHFQKKLWKWLSNHTVCTYILVYTGTVLTYWQYQ